MEEEQMAYRTYKGWEAGVPKEISEDTLWKMEAYRLGLFLSDVGWRDVSKLIQDRRMVGLADQLYRALGSISANLAEGYSRGTGRDRARFYEYALGSARESRDWYYKSRHILGDAAFAHRLAVLTQVVRLLLTMIPQQRGHSLHEAGPAYLPQPDLPSPPESFSALLSQDIPFP